MRKSFHIAVPFKPTNIYAFVDKIQVAFKHPLSMLEYAWMRSECKQMLRLRGKARFNPRYRFRFTFCQPSRDLLLQLSKIEGSIFNHVELSLDLIFDSQQDLDLANAFTCRFFVKKHHRDQGIRYCGDTRYTGGRWEHPNLVAIYADKPSKVTGEVLCLHIDWRAYGVKALERIGLKSTADLANLDHEAFWRNRLLLSKCDPDRLGRMNLNKLKRTDRRSPWITQTKMGSRAFKYNMDRATGNLMIHAAGYEGSGPDLEFHSNLNVGSTQAVIDDLRKRLNVRNCLMHYETEHLLPKKDNVEDFFYFSDAYDLKSNVLS